MRSACWIPCCTHASQTFPKLPLQHKSRPGLNWSIADTWNSYKGKLVILWRLAMWIVG